MMSKVLLVGDINIDVLGKVSDFPNEGEEVEVEGLEVRVGGAAFNTAVVLKRYQLAPILFASIGNDTFGEYVLNVCRERGISTDFIQQKPVATGMVFSLNTPRDKAMFTLRGANKELSDPERVYSVLEESEMVYFSAYAFIEGEQRKTSYDLLHYLGRLKKYMVLALSLLSIRKDKKAVKELVNSFDLVSMNDTEYMELFGDVEPTQLGLERSALLITRGDRGADYYSKNRHVGLTLDKVSSGYLVGAGDAFLGGFMAGLLLYASIEKALRIAGDSAREWIV